MKNITASAQRGFTLIELLVVIGVLAVLLAITLIAINPARQFSQANDTKRASDVNALLNAVHQYGADNKGNLAGLGTISTDPTAPTDISQAGIGAGFCDALVTQYLAALPSDPTGGLAGNPVLKADCATYGDTGYKIIKSSTDNRITVTAPLTEISPTMISVTR
ncbi:MAG TPA: type II secretion system protein [Candidatus Saccharimonadia bacterium]|nr:type II secretion system protein [Candidatus Saccharimonadia bacterium]